jgi:hypothetical protein
MLCAKWKILEIRQLLLSRVRYMFSFVKRNANPSAAPRFQHRFLVGFVLIDLCIFV